MEATKAKHAKELQELKAELQALKVEHQEQRKRFKGVLVYRKRQIDELSGAARSAGTRGKDYKILRRMMTLWGVKFVDSERRMRALLKDTFQLQADLRFEHQQCSS